jgi:hypothetical protein
VLCRHARILYHVAGHLASIWAPSYFYQRDIELEGYTDLSLASYLGINEVVHDILVKEKLYLDNNGVYLFREKSDADSMGKDSYDSTELSRKTSTCCCPKRYIGLFLKDMRLLSSCCSRLGRPSGD